MVTLSYVHKVCQVGNYRYTYENMSSLSSPPPIHSHHIRRDWQLLSAAVFLFGFGFALYGAVFLNFITRQLGVGALQMGVLESSREIPGLLAVGIAAAVAHYAEARIGALCLCLSALGVAATGFVHSFGGLVLVTVFWSIFMHQWFTSSSALPLALAAGQESGRHLGRMGAIGAAATVLAFIMVLILGEHITYANYFTTAHSSSSREDCACCRCHRLLRRTGGRACCIGKSTGFFTG